MYSAVDSIVARCEVFAGPQKRKPLRTLRYTKENRSYPFLSFVASLVVGGFQCPPSSLANFS